MSKYGDLGESTTSNAKDRTVKWSNMLNNWNSFSTRRSSKLKKRIRKGIPDGFRGMVWNLLAKTEELRRTHTPSYYDLLLESSEDSAVSSMIDLDLDRTFPEHEMFKPGGSKQPALRRVLMAYSIYDPVLGYCQGMGFIVGLFLINMQEEQAFWLLVGLMNNYGIREMYLPGMKDLYRTMYICNYYFRKYLPSAWSHMKEGNVLPCLLIPNWFLSLFVNVLPLESTLRVIDVLFSEGTKVFIRVFLAVFRLGKNDILEAPREKLLHVANALPAQCSSDILFPAAFSFNISRRKIDELCEEYEENPEEEIFIR